MLGLYATSAEFTDEAVKDIIVELSLLLGDINIMNDLNDLKIIEDFQSSLGDGTLFPRTYLIPSNNTYLVDVSFRHRFPSIIYFIYSSTDQSKMLFIAYDRLNVGLHFGAGSAWNVWGVKHISCCRTFDLKDKIKILPTSFFNKTTPKTVSKLFKGHLRIASKPSPRCQ